MKYSRYNALDGLTVFDSEGAEFDMDLHVHDEFVIASYISGTKKYSSKGETNLLNSGDFLSISPRIAHSAKSLHESGCHYLAMYPTFEQVSDAIGVDIDVVEQRLSGVKTLSASNRGVDLGKELKLSLEENETSIEFALSVFLSNLMSELGNNSSSQQSISDNIERIWSSIYEDPMQDVDLGTLATDVSVSKEHLCRTFKSAYGISPFQLLRARRTVHARNLIQNGVPLASAAIDSGFSDQSHMSRWFRRIYGVSPKSFILHQ